MAERPGIMIYFDLEPALSMLSDAEAGQLFRAAMEYGHYGTVPEFDGLLAMAWSFVQPKIDRDNEAYQKKCMDNAYNRYKGVCKERGTEPLDKETWVKKLYQPSSTTVNNGCNPSPTTEGTPNGTSKSSSSGTTTTTSGGSKGGGALHPLPENEETNFDRMKAEKLEQLRALQ